MYVILAVFYVCNDNNINKNNNNRNQISDVNGANQAEFV